MEALAALILTIIVLNVVSKGLSFYYTVVFTGPSTTQPIMVPFVDSSSHPEMFLKVSQN